MIIMASNKSIFIFDHLGERMKLTIEKETSTLVHVGLMLSKFCINFSYYQIYLLFQSLQAFDQYKLVMIEFSGLHKANRQGKGKFIKKN